MKFELYKIYAPAQKDVRPRALWAWRLRADNGRVVAHHNQGYNSKTDMIFMLFKMFEGSKQEEALREALKGDPWKVALRGDEP